MKNSRINYRILVPGLALIAVSVFLFATGLFVRDYGQPGQEGFFNGSSIIYLVLAFTVLVVLAFLLLVIAARRFPFSPSAPGSSVEAAPEMGRKAGAAAAGRERSGEQAGDHGPGTQPKEVTAPASEVLAEAAGELKTSVGAIQEELEDIIDDETPADKEHMQSLYQETDRLKKIIEGMEQLSQAQALARSLKKKQIQLKPFLDGIIERTKASVGNPDLALANQCDPDVALTTDPDCLGRIIVNIVDNAVKAVKGAGSVTVAAVRKGEQVVVSVTDTGTGIRPRQLPHIYERFFRGSGSGIGMGLSIVKELVDACGGKIEVKTRAGEGTTFSVQFPG